MESTPTDVGADDGGSTPVEWAGDPERDFRPVLKHLGLGAGLAFMLPILFLLGSLVLDVDPADPLSLAVFVLLFVGGPGSILYVLLAAEFLTDEQRAQLPKFDWVRLPWLLAALPFGVLVIYSGVTFEPLLVVWLTLFFLAYYAAASRHGHGLVDSSTGEVVYFVDGQRYESDVRGLSHIRWVSLGGHAWCWLGFGRGHLFASRTVLAVPVDQFPPVRAELEAVAARDYDGYDAGGIGRAERVVVAGFGVFVLGVAVAFAFVDAVPFGFSVLISLSAALFLFLSWW
ncbi:hypothetical protein AUR64_13270 [Haloprofundus marisrubri]|uniref:Uncharacterized protein n=1 Tax=Haloprofundus marisrubri TaxID=1514971 RepID=A0A0W1R6P2_9EURY|nr:hypothetical protein [Haloprofundus marisrubri]KTG08791.1 hypothetical protein AUR64_13270 [Haloprofundus marisrubri]